MGACQTKNAALKTTLAFHYQVLIGLERCFSMQEGQSIWFERDGDVSLIGDSPDGSKQVEVKNYADALTDHHENLWKTLKNWLASEFKHESYGSLVLHTTQAFGTKTTLRGWNDQSADIRLEVLSDIFATRSTEELTAKNPKAIVQLQKSVIKVDEEKLKAVLAKVVLFTEAEDERVLRDKILSRLIGIPDSNQERYLLGLVGFVYSKANSKTWVIKKSDFKAICEDLNTTYSRKEYTFPPFIGYEPSEGEIKQYEESLFIKKINDIEHYNAIPDALGNWIELHNALDEELDEYPLFRDKTNQYQKDLIKKLRLNYSSAQLSGKFTLNDSKLFYNQTISEAPLNMGSVLPDIKYKNGLIHDAMDNGKEDLKWKIEP